LHINLLRIEREVLKTQLVCTFSKKFLIDDTISKIKNNFLLYNNKIFLFKPLEIKEDYMLSYNVVMDAYKKFLPNSIMVHQKRETNTIYTINALNELIMNLNNGILDKTYPIEWERYKNSALLKNKDGFRVVKIILVNVYSF
jgi:hypothetical protein